MFSRNTLRIASAKFLLIEFLYPCNKLPHTPIATVFFLATRRADHLLQYGSSNPAMPLLHGNEKKMKTAGKRFGFIIQAILIVIFVLIAN